MAFKQACLLAAVLATAVAAEEVQADVTRHATSPPHSMPSDIAHHREDVLKHQQRVMTAHGICMAVAFAFMLPFGSALLRLLTFRSTWIIHGAWNTTAYVVALAGFGMGVWLAHARRLLTHAHPIIGIIVIGLLFVQPLGGTIAHMKFKTQGRNKFGMGHRWLGRVIVTLGGINGGLGIWLARASQKWIIAYSVVAGVTYVFWLVASLVDWYRNRRHENDGYDSESKYSVPYMG